MRKLIIILFVCFIWIGCSKKDYSFDDFQNDYNSTLECLAEHGHIDSPNDVPPVNYKIVEGDKVECGDTASRGCYFASTHTIVLPVNSNKTTVKHEFIEAALQSTGKIQSGHDHSHPGFADCAGIEIRK